MKHSIKYLAVAFSLSLVACAPPVTTPTEVPPTSTPSAQPSTSPTASPSSSTSPTAPVASTEPGTAPGTSPSTVPTTAPNSNNVNVSRVASVKFTQSTNRFLNKENEERQLEVVLLDASGNTLPADTVTLDWLSSRSQDVSIDANGRVKAVAGLGYSKITVRVSGTNIEDSILFDVADPAFFTSPIQAAAQPEVVAEVVPEITSLSVTHCLACEPLTIYGKHFSEVASENVVKFGDVVAKVKSSSTTAIEIEVPALEPGEASFTLTVKETALPTQTITIDPLPHFTLNGEAANDQAGNALASVGDVNGDGKDDFIIGARGANKTYVIYGGSITTQVFELSTLDGTNGFAIAGTPSNLYLGDSVSGVGDINGDGIGDLIIGDYHSNAVTAGAGAAYVIYGGVTTATVDLSNLGVTDGFAINGEGLNNYLGAAVAGGDFNGDGIGDLAIGAYGVDPGATTNGGRVYVIYGTGANLGATTFDLSSLNGDNGYALQGEATGSLTGNVLSSAGDFSGDGKDDLLIGAYYATANGANQSGKAYVVYGKDKDNTGSVDLSDLGDLNSPGFVINGETANDRLGYSLSDAGDFNGDGKNDIIIGSQHANKAYVIYGGSINAATFNASALSTATGFSITGETADDQFGRSVSGGGDFNGDGQSDILIGATGAGDYDGKAYLIYGHTPTASTFDLSTLDDSKGLVINGLSTENEAGDAVSMGDFNGDKKVDLLISSKHATSSSAFDAGQVYVIVGGCLSTTGKFDLSTITPAYVDDEG